MTDRADVYEAREVVHTVRHGRRIFVIDHVPAEVCSVCGDVVFAPETVRRLKPFARRPQRPRGPCHCSTMRPPCPRSRGRTCTAPARRAVVEWQDNTYVQGQKAGDNL